MAGNPLRSLADYSRLVAEALEQLHILHSTFPHHKHLPPDIRHHRVPAPEMSFNKPNLPFLVGELAKLSGS